MPTLTERVTTAVELLEADAQIQHDVSNGTSTETVTTEAGQVRTVANAIATLMATVARGAWLTTTVYAQKDLVTQTSNVYICVVAHTAGVFATDLAAGKWALFAGPADEGSIATGFARQRRRGNRADSAAFTGLAGELTFDTTLAAVRAHDGATAGGRVMSRSDWHGSNIKLYGAVMDGVTDDSAAFVAAQDATGAVFIPPGNTKIASTVYIHGRAKRLYGCGMGVSTITVAAGIVGIIAGNETGDVDENHDMVIEHVKISGGTYPLQVGSAIVPTAFLGKVSNVWLTGGSAGGLFLHSAQHALFECLEITANAKGIVSLTTGGTNTNCRFVKCRSYLNTAEGMYLEQALGFTFQTVNFESNGKEGVKLSKNDGYSVAGLYFNGCWFESNLADLSTGSAQVLAVQAGGATTSVSEIGFEACEFNGVTTPASNIHLKLYANIVMLGSLNRYLTPSTACINLTQTNASGIALGHSASQFVASQKVAIFAESITLPDGDLTLTAGDIAVTVGNTTLSNGRVRATSGTGEYHMFRSDGLADNGTCAIFQQSTSGNTLEVHWYACGADGDRMGLYWGLQGIANTRMWIDDTGDLRVSSATPAADDSGTVVGTQTFSGTHIYKLGDADLKIGEAVRLFKRKLWRTTSANDPLCCGVFAGRSELLTTSFDEKISRTFGPDIVLKDKRGAEIRKISGDAVVAESDKPGAVISLGDTRFKQSGQEINGVLVDGPVSAGDFFCSSATPGRFTKQSDNVQRNYTVGKFMEDGNASAPVYAYILK